jgi:hypothetical protein
VAREGVGENTETSHSACLREISQQNAKRKKEGLFINKLTTTPLEATSSLGGGH